MNYPCYIWTKEKKNKYIALIILCSHLHLRMQFLKIMKGIIEEGNYYQWKDVYPGYRGNYKESSIIQIKLRDKLMNWSETKAELIEGIHQITYEFLGKMDEII